MQTVKKSETLIQGNKKAIISYTSYLQLHEFSFLDLNLYLNHKICYSEISAVDFKCIIIVFFCLSDSWRYKVRGADPQIQKTALKFHSKLIKDNPK